MECGHCKDCEHYSGFWFAFGYGSCDLASSNYGEPDHDDTKAYATDTDSYSAGLRVKPDFGCVQWQAATKPILE